MHETLQYDKDSRWRTIPLIVAGNIFEWYDFAVYGYAVDAIARNFFPASDSAAGLIQAFGVFAVGFLGRIGGGLLYGVVGDRIGRFCALRMSLASMAVSTALISLLPGYTAIGMLAPVLLTVLRLLQGASIGGEFPTSLTVVAETMAPGKKAFASGLVAGAAVVGFVCGSAVGALVQSILSPAEMAAWGWRIPFGIGSILAVVMWKLRAGLGTEIKANRAACADEQVAGAANLKRGGRTFAGAALYMVGFYVPFLYLSTPLGRSKAWLFTAALMILSLASPIAGLVADRYGVRKLLLVSGIVFTSASPLLLWMVADGRHVAPAVIAFAFLYAPINAVGMLPLVQQFPEHLRLTGFSLSFNVAAVAFGGCSPLLAELIVRQTGTVSGLWWLLLAAAPLSLWAWRTANITENGLRGRTPVPGSN